MELTRVYAELEALLTRFQIEVRAESFDPRLFGDLTSRGGLCTIRGQRAVLVDRNAPLVDRVAVLARAASQLDTESVYVTPAVRQVIASHRQEPLPDVRPLRLVFRRPSDE